MKDKEKDYLNNPYDYDLANIFNELAGGINQEWVRILRNVGQKTENKGPQLGGEVMGDLAYELRKNFERINPIEVDPNKFHSVPELFNAVSDHARRWQRLSKSTIDHRMRCARRMTRHPLFPIDFFHLNYEQFIAYMQYREDIEKAKHFALKNDLQAIQMFLVAYGQKPRDWYYRLPVQEKHKERILPLPDKVHEMITFNFSDDAYENSLYQYLHAHNFWIGWRVPSEPQCMTVDNIDFDTGSIIITERKKHNSTRQIFPEETIMTGKTRKSFKNWLRWRDKVETSKSGNSLYLQPSGKPFTLRYFGHKISETGKMVYPTFRPYDSRHWCAVARLIQTKVETGSFDPYKVQKWLGHDKIDTTEGYIQHAENYFRRAPYNWIKRTLKFYSFNYDKKGECEKIETRPKNLRFEWKLSEKQEWTCRDLNPRPPPCQGGDLPV